MYHRYVYLRKGWNQDFLICVVLQHIGDFNESDRSNRTTTYGTVLLDDNSHLSMAVSISYFSVLTSYRGLQYKLASYQYPEIWSFCNLKIYNRSCLCYIIFYLHIYNFSFLDVPLGNFFVLPWFNFFT